jgi:hypothetical protein
MEIKKTKEEDERRKLGLAAKCKKGMRTMTAVLALEDIPIRI